MKQVSFFQSLTQQMTQWRRLYKMLRLVYLSKTSPNSGSKGQTVLHSKTLCYGKNSIYRVGLSWLGEKQSPLVFTIAVISLTGVLGHKLYNQPQLKVGTIAPSTMRVPYSSEIEDSEKTESERQKASQSSTPVLMIDTRINEKINQKLQHLLDEGNEIRSIVGSFPFFDTFVLSLPTQHYLRSCSEWEWQALLQAIEAPGKQTKGLLAQPQGNLEIQKHKNSGSRFKPFSLRSQLNTTKTLPSSKSPNTSESQAKNTANNAEFTKAVSELVTYRFTTSERNFSSLIDQISRARQGYARALVKLSELATNKSPVVDDKASLLNLSDQEWTKTQTGIQQSAERILTQGIPLGLPTNILHNAVNLQVQQLVPKVAEPLAKKILSNVLQPNLKIDEVQTNRLAQRAADDVQPVMVVFKQGQVIVEKGKKITAWNFQVLEHYHLIRREINWLGLMQLGATVSGSIAIFSLVERRVKCRLRQSDRLLVLLLTLSTPAVLTMGIPYTTWSTVGLLLGSFYGRGLSVTVIGLLLLLIPLSLEVSLLTLLAGAAGGIVGSCIAQRLRSREELALLGIAIALTEGVTYLLLELLFSAAWGSASYMILQEAGLFALSGLSWSIVALGLSPYLEKLFDLVTPIRLAELSNPNRPLLKRLATEAPGTFQHTLFVATLAEAAAKQLGCNVELVRAGTLYHDIGKMHDPLAFIENQMGGPNKHDTEVKNPWKSADIIKKHVSQGLVMARKHSLPTAIQAFIPEHQGTMQIAYFYHQAKQKAQEDATLEVHEADFRYDGPNPQSRETAIVMLADSCEAALRSLKDGTSEQALAMVNGILRARWQDQQLQDSGLTRAEMSLIADIFVQVWQQFHHKRIAYPKLKNSQELK